MKERILLLFPQSFEPNIYPPQGITLLAACLRMAGHKVDILDLTVEPKQVPNWRNYTILGMTLLCANYYSGLKLAKHVRSQNKQIRIVAGGPFADNCTEEVLKSGAADIVVHGEGEETFVQLIETIEMGYDYSNIKGLSFLRNDEIIHTPIRRPIEDLDKLPFPAYELLPLEKYQDTEPPRYATILASRGCPYGCVFCTRGPAESKKMRYMSPERVLEWVTHLIKNFGYKNIHFIDSTFTLDQKRAEKICDLIIDCNLKFQWSCMTRIDCINRPLLAKMKKAGCATICAGIESGNDEILKLLKKGFTKKDVESAVQLFREGDAPNLSLSFIIGHPWDTRQTILETGRFARSLRKNRGISSGFLMMVPFPGTELWDNSEKWGLKIKKDWKNFFKMSFKGDNLLCEANFDTPYLSHKELNSLYKKILNTYGPHGRFEPIFTILRKIKPLRQLVKYHKNIFQKLLNISIGC